jgi:hypothetical protein
MIIAMTAVRMMQVAIDEIIHMIAVRHRFVPTAGAMHMIGRVRGARMARGASAGVGRRDGQRVFFDLARAGRVVQVTIVEIIHMVAMLNGRVPTSGAVSVVMMRMSVTHTWSPVRGTNTVGGAVQPSLSGSHSINNRSI